MLQIKKKQLMMFSDGLSVNQTLNQIAYIVFLWRLSLGQSSRRRPAATSKHAENHFAGSTLSCVLLNLITAWTTAMKASHSRDFTMIHILGLG